MRTLHHFIRYTLPIGILLAVVVLSPGPGTKRAGQALHDFAHAPVFACITILVLVLLAQRQRQPRTPAWLQYPLAFLLAALLGLATEILQKWSGGDASWADLRSDVVGAAAACGAFAGFDRRIARLDVRRCSLMAALALLTWHSLPFARVGLAYLHRNEEFPTLFDARDAGTDRFVVATSAQLHYTTLPLGLGKAEGEPTLRVRLQSGDWPGVALEEPYPDWSGQRRLMIDVANPEETSLELTLRVLDEAHDWTFEDRFNATLEIAPRTRKTFAISLADIESAPAGRRLDLEQIADVRLFADGPAVGRNLFLTRVWLE